MVWVALLFEVLWSDFGLVATFGSQTDIAVARHNTLFYGFPDIQLVVEMTPNHIHLSNYSVYQIMDPQHAYKPSRMDLGIELLRLPGRGC